MNLYIGGIIMTIETMTFTCAWKGCCKEVHYDEILCAEHDELVVNACSTMDHMTAMPNEDGMPEHY
jgi:hypothetical protein